MATPRVEPPITHVNLVTPYPNVKAKRGNVPLREVLTPGCPCVIHMYTGWGGCWPCAQAMDRWAAQYAEAATFLTVCCDGPRLAEQFGSQLRLRNVTNTYVDDGHRPAWGQLGCNGFIVLDGTHSVVCKATSAFLEVRELAFKHVETLLETLLGGKSPSLLGPGTFVRLAGLVAEPELNGRLALCLESPAAEGRCAVQLVGVERKLRVSVEKLVVEPMDDSDDGESEAEAEAEAEREEAGADACVGGEWHKSARGPRESASSKRARGAADDAARPDGTIAPLQATPSVKVAVLDEQHARCEAALSALASRRDAEALRALLVEYTAHFAEEEALLDTHLYARVVDGSAAAAAGFSADASARTSHFADHSRMIATLKAAECSAADGAALSPAFVEAALRDFEQHAGRYDGAYADRLSASLAR